jgi:hypothetical protein
VVALLLKVVALLLKAVALLLKPLNFAFSICPSIVSLKSGSFATKSHKLLGTTKRCQESLPVKRLILSRDKLF